ncbi:MAG TPA: DNA mismatch repair endonuclease MutL, partial [Phycisphaerales bacterium]|nr:DNA mismatch repair endonuclease MutL [Phycisphaerales bacterium]
MSSSPATTLPRIRALPALVANQIAAGEVVERPASVVKELVENSLDAGATRVQLDIESGGIELIRVTDDGCGISRDDLPLAIAPHATSKIASVEDLDQIATLGFRGEALASIASVSRTSIRSRTPASDGAFELEVEGATIKPIRPASGNIGTTITVRNLFFNTPARRKFLKTVNTERERCAETFQALVLAHPNVAFTMTVDGKRTLDVPANQGPHQRTLAILGKELESQLIPVAADRFDDARGVSLWGLAGLPSLARGSTKSQHVFVNGRNVRDKTIQHAIAEAYRGLIEPGRYPTVLLMLDMSPQGVDVNVHPQKAEVRFRDSGLVHSIVLRALRDALRKADVTPTVLSLRPQLAWSPHAGTQSPGQMGLASALMGAQAPAASGLPPQEVSPTIAAAKFAEFFSKFRPGQQQFPLSLAEGLEQTRKLEAAAEHAHPPEPAAQPAPASRAFAIESQQPLLQVHKSYVITQDEQGVVIIDQHALHERVMFEYLLARVAQGRLERQHLLTPEPIDVSPAQLAALPALQPLFDRIGIDAEPFGPLTIAVRSFPSFLFERGVDIAPFMNELLTKAERGELGRDASPDAAQAPVPTSLEHALRDVLDMMACKAAIKAGDDLAADELAELVKLRTDVERSSNCPHGRP